eukprot:maker-scaffold_8-snap-gene-7.18-mRNA-1 protein AED:0.04 eAED:0.04 QI:0/0/0/1/1/1/2/0/224
MESIRLKGVKVLNNPASYKDDFQFEITFENGEELPENVDLEWRLTYVANADSDKDDQILDTMLVGPVPVGVSRFLMKAPAPDYKKIPTEKLLGVTVLFISCLFEEKEFIRIGYYVNNVYEDPLAVYNESANEKEEEKVVDLDEESEGEEDEGSTGEEVKSDESKEENSEPNKKKVKLDDKTDVGKEVLEKIEEEVKIPVNFDIDKVKRHILSDKPKVTKMEIRT